MEVEVGEDVWTTVRLWDNADDVNEHHLHRYTRQEGKQRPEISSFKSINEAMAVANDEAREREGDREKVAAVMTERAALPLTTQKMIAWGQDPERFDRYPNRTHFIEIENPEHDRMAKKTLLRGDPVVPIYPDGSELLIDPDPGGGARIETRDSSGRPVAA